MIIKFLSLESARDSLLILEAPILTDLSCRLHYQHNRVIYEPEGSSEELSLGKGLFWHVLRRIEKVYGDVGRYTDPSERPFIKQEYDLVRKGRASVPMQKYVNLNDRLLKSYLAFLSRFYKEKNKDNRNENAAEDKSDDGHHGSAVQYDIAGLQECSQRIHDGEVVAESKYQKDKGLYNELIASSDREGLLACLTVQEVEDVILDKIKDYLQANHHMHPSLSADKGRSFFSEVLIPLTKDVEVEYLLARYGQR
ncbi:hypothetical protein JW711_05935 [Candidatus Woesearchaeota archaeon]|nr:hypothetical protein [Candidatus Woesearchaeota archaeon]